MDFDYTRPDRKGSRWIDRAKLIELLQEVPADARLITNDNGNLLFISEKHTGYIDFENKLVELVPDHNG